jgi:DNA-binding NarL/FixJ family response regulator
MIKIFLVGDQPSIGKGLQMQMALESDFTVIGGTGDCLSASRLIRELKPDVVVLDLDMPDRDGFTALHAIHSQGIDIPVIILSFQADPVSRQRALASGATDFIEKHSGGTELFAAIRRLAGGPKPSVSMG